MLSQPPRGARGSGRGGLLLCYSENRARFKGESVAIQSIATGYLLSRLVIKGVGYAGHQADG